MGWNSSPVSSHREMLSPTILITAYPTEKVRTQALKAGVIGYLPKPFSDTHLLGYLNWALEHRKAS